MIELKNVSKFYYSKGIIASGFTKINLKFKIGEFVAITGESGSGKSTLLNVISGLDTYEEGEMFVEGKETSHYLEKDWENYRRKYIGNIYQNFNLINSYTVYQNIDLILSLNGVKRKERKTKIIELLKRVNMLKYKNTKVSKLSGGQKQRVAIARALAKDVPVIIADEPTGNLDKKSADEVIKLLREISKDKLIIIVTHNYDQVEEYVTRKITMHDGKVLEDRKLKEIPKEEYSLNNYTFKNIKPLEKLIVGFRNTFNIVPKFILLLLVYLFIVAGLMGEYSFFKKEEYQASKSGYNYIFSDLSDKRIIINKKDRTAFSKEEIEKIKNKDNIDHIIENDLIVDDDVNFADESEEQWFSGLLRSHENMPRTNIIGNIPIEENEVLIECREDDYIMNNPDNIIGKEIYFWDNYAGGLDKSAKYTVTGLRVTENSSDHWIMYKIYASEKVLKDRLFINNQNYSTITVDFLNETVSSNFGYNTIVPNDWVYEGTAFISEDESYRCDKFKCIDKTITLHLNNPYFQETKELRVAKTYNKKNINQIMTLPNYNPNEYDYMNNGKIYINTNDYKALFNKDTYQMSVYIKDIDLIETTVKELEKSGYNTLKIKDTLVNDVFSQILRVIKIVVTIIFIIVLFFISYFVIKIILKSRNIYFSILRMLGASKKVCIDLLIIELFVISNISYFTFITIAEMNKHKIINVGFIDTVNRYFKFDDYIILYIILIVMSFILSLRYARKLFKSSVMSSYREEV